MIPGEEVALQHQLLVCHMMFDMPPKIKHKYTPRPKVWKLRDPQMCSHFQEVFKAHVHVVETEAATTMQETWVKLKSGLLKTTEEVCGTTKPHRWRHETWWWNKEVVNAITAKPQAFKAWRLANAYKHHITLPSASPDVWCTRHATKQTRWSMRVLITSRLHIFRLANQMRKENVDVVGDKPVKNDAGEMSMSEEAECAD